MITSAAQMATDLYQAGRRAMDAGNKAEATALFRSSIELEPHFKTLELLGEILLDGEVASSEAVVVLAASCGLGNKQSRPYFLLGKALMMRGDLEGAISRLDLAIELQPAFRKAIELRDDIRSRLDAVGSS